MIEYITAWNRDHNFVSNRSEVIYVRDLTDTPLVLEGPKD